MEKLANSEAMRLWNKPIFVAFAGREKCVLPFVGRHKALRHLPSLLLRHSNSAKNSFTSRPVLNPQPYRRFTTHKVSRIFRASPAEGFFLPEKNDAQR